MKETNIMRLIQVALSQADVLSFRNNCGQYRTSDGVVIRYGVGNPGGSDLICCTPVTVTSDMVGQTIGVFTAIEVKTPTGKSSANQRSFISAIKAVGGRAGIARNNDDAIAIARPDLYSTKP